MILLSVGCFRPGMFEERPQRGPTSWRALEAGEKDAVRRRLADERIDLRESDIEAVRVPGSDAPYVAWSKPWSFHGAEVVCEFRIIRFRAGARGTGWPPAFTVFREPRVESEGLVWSDGPAPALSVVGRVRYRWDIFIIDVRETRHCLFYERQLDHHERQHLLYAERLIRRLQEDGEDLVSRLLRKTVESAHEGRDGGSEVMRQGFIQRRVERFVAEHRALRNRYGTAAEEEARVARESIAVLESDIEDLEANCLASTSASDGE